METPHYIHLRPGDLLPRIGGAGPFKAVVIIEAPVTQAWQQEVSEWLVRSGCLYMMAWGENCSAWDTSVDVANLEVFDFGDIPEDDSVMTTWHEEESLADTFWYSEFCAFHPTRKMPETYLVHISRESKGADLLRAFLEARQTPS
ncbi:MAG: hypothetical protein ACK4P2_07115 [Hyphomonas sp.]